MIKLLILFLCLLISFSGLKAQVKNIDSFSKYSYYFFGQADDSILIEGTCFFIKSHNQYYFFTAKHIITGINPVTNNRNHTLSDTFFLRLYTNSGIKKFVRLYIPAFIKRSSNYIFYKEPDLFIAKIELPDSFQINSIEKFMKMDYKKINPDSAFLFGFPQTNPYMKDFDSAINKESEYVKGNVYGSIHQNVFMPNLKRYDSLNYLLNINESIDHGFIGSPVFLKNNNNTVFFGGVCVWGNKEKAAILRPQNLINKLNSNDSITAILIVR